MRKYAWVPFIKIYLLVNTAFVKVIDLKILQILSRNTKYGLRTNVEQATFNVKPNAFELNNLLKT